MMTLPPPPLSLYIHLPWCIKKCPYCDFNSHQAGTSIPEKAYVDRLLQDLEADLPLIWGRVVQTIFIGGGTPSLFSAREIERLLEGVRARVLTKPDLEITLEANPGTFEQQKFHDYRKAGINRLSIGIQSFQDEQLSKLGRVHKGDEARRAIEIAIKAGFTEFNLDLMHGLPNQTLEQALMDLEIALSYNPPHLSWYQLTIEPETVFAKHPPTLPTETRLAAIQEEGQRYLEKAGLKQYEVSAYARDGHQCQHNLNYWQFGDYLGIGAGAHGKITLQGVASEGVPRQVSGVRCQEPGAAPLLGSSGENSQAAEGTQTYMSNETSSQQSQREKGEGQIHRYVKTKLPRLYLDPTSPLITEHKVIPTSELPFEFMLNALRLIDGVPNELFSSRTGLPLSTIQAAWLTCQEKGLLVKNQDRLQTTHLGLQFLNNCLEYFF